MNTAKVLIGLSLGVAVALLITTDKGKDIREDIADTAKKLKKKLDKLADKSGKELSDLQNLVSKNIEGLSDDAREKIMSILENGTDTAKSAKKTLSKQMS